MGITKLAINIAIKKPKIENYQRYLFLGPHPDDIEIGCGATIAKLSKMGKDICFLICTDGRYGDGFIDKSKITNEMLAEIRKNESVASAKELGVDNVKFLGLCDGNNYDIEDMKKGIAKVINDFKPDIIFAIDPDVKSECHADHLNVGRAAKELANFANYPNILKKYLPEDTKVNEGINIDAIALYMTASPNVYVRTGKKLLNMQLHALFENHKSQYPEGSSDKASIQLYLKLRSLDFGLRRFCFHAEGFRVLNKTMMHCLPEASK